MLCGFPAVSIAEQPEAEAIEGETLPMTAENDKEPISNEAKVHSELLDYLYQSSDNAIMTNTEGRISMGKRSRPHNRK